MESHVFDTFMSEILNKLENLNNNGANTNKFKFQDSCMSFKKLDLSQLDYSMTNQNKNSTSNMITNQKINEKIDSIHDMLTSFLKNNFMTEPNKNDKKLVILLPIPNEPREVPS